MREPLVPMRVRSPLRRQQVAAEERCQLHLQRWLRLDTELHRSPGLLLRNSQRIVLV